MIRARISKKYEKRHWDNSRGKGSLLNFELIDSNGTVIQATIFTAAVEKFDTIIEEGKVYVFTNG